MNARDLDVLCGLVTDDVRFPSPRGGLALQGDKGLQALVAAATEARLQLVPEGEPAAADGGLVMLPVRVSVGEDELRGTALFEVRDGKVASFEVVTDLMRER